MNSTPTDRAAAAHVSDHKRGNVRDPSGFAVRLRSQARKRPRPGRVCGTSSITSAKTCLEEADRRYGVSRRIPSPASRARRIACARSPT
jgi:hypothetical protein